MSKLSAFERAKQLAEENAKTVHNMHETTSGGSSERVVLPDGEYYGYLCEYIDLGKHEDVYKGESKGVFDTFRGGVALFYYPSDLDETLEPSEDEKLEYTVVPIFDTPIKTGDRSAAVKIFKGLNVSNDTSITSIPQFLGVPRRFRVESRISQTTKKPYNVINYAATGPAREGRRAVELPDVDERDVRVFFWNSPTIEDWNSLEIEVRKRDDGTFTENFIQEAIASALNFAGSPIDLLLQGEGLVFESKAPAKVEEPEKVSDEHLASPDEDVEDTPPFDTDKEAEEPVEEKTKKETKAAVRPRTPRVPRRPTAK